jgi:iron(III) transport system substrate-binding protein
MAMPIALRSGNGQRVLCAALLLGLLWGGGFSTSTAAQEVRDIEALLRPLERLPQAEREKILVENAKKEGSVVWYTTDGPAATQDLFKAFAAKYPFIKPRFIRAKSAEILDRITSETRAGRYLFDLAKTSTDTFELYPPDIFAAYTSPATAEIPPVMKREKWTSLFTFVRALGYNSNLIKAADVPKGWDDLLDPRWKGKILFDSSSLPELIMLYSRWGREKTETYLDRLGSSGNLRVHDGRTTITQLLAAGEAPLALTVYPYDIEGLAKKGAPVDWGMLDPTLGLLQPNSIARRAPNPYSAALLYDFLFSADGQRVYARMGRTPTNPNVASSSPREVAAVQDARLYLEGEIPKGINLVEMQKMLDEKVLNRSFKK